MGAVQQQDKHHSIFAAVRRTLSSFPALFMMPVLLVRPARQLLAWPVSTERALPSKLRRDARAKALFGLKKTPGHAHC